MTATERAVANLPASAWAGAGAGAEQKKFTQMQGGSNSSNSPLTKETSAQSNSGARAGQHGAVTDDVLTKRAECQLFMRGRCHYGDQCKYVHKARGVTSSLSGGTGATSAGTSTQSSTEATPANSACLGKRASTGNEDGLAPEPVSGASAATNESSTLYPVRSGATDCQYYLKTGKCNYGSRCKFNHPHRDESLVNALNRRDCFDFVQTGTCPYGRNCKYNHPPRTENIIIGSPVSMSSPTATVATAVPASAMLPTAVSAENSKMPLNAQKKTQLGAMEEGDQIWDALVTNELPVTPRNLATEQVHGQNIRESTGHASRDPAFVGTKGNALFGQSPRRMDAVRAPFAGASSVPKPWNGDPTPVGLQQQKQPSNRYRRDTPSKRTAIVPSELAVNRGAQQMLHADSSMFSNTSPIAMDASSRPWGDYDSFSSWNQKGQYLHLSESNASSSLYTSSTALAAPPFGEQSNTQQQYAQTSFWGGANPLSAGMCGTAPQQTPAYHCQARETATVSLGGARGLPTASSDMFDGSEANIGQDGAFDWVHNTHTKADPKLTSQAANFHHRDESITAKYLRAGLAHSSPHYEEWGFQQPRRNLIDRFGRDAVASTNQNPSVAESANGSHALNHPSFFRAEAAVALVAEQQTEQRAQQFVGSASRNSGNSGESFDPMVYNSSWSFGAVANTRGPGADANVWRPDAGSSVFGPSLFGMQHSTY